MGRFWCAILGHPDEWVAELDNATLTRHADISSMAGELTVLERPHGGELADWRCVRCRERLHDILREYREAAWWKDISW